MITPVKVIDTSCVALTLHTLSSPSPLIATMQLLEHSSWLSSCYSSVSTSVLSESSTLSFILSLFYHLCHFYHLLCYLWKLRRRIYDNSEVQIFVTPLKTRQLAENRIITRLKLAVLVVAPRCQGDRLVDGDSKHLWNVGMLPLDSVALQHIRLSLFSTRRCENLKSYPFFASLFFVLVEWKITGTSLINEASSKPLNFLWSVLCFPWENRLSTYFLPVGSLF
jgi:hypothetical protein